MIREVHLHGLLGKRFGRRHRLDVQTPAEAVRALSLMIPSFRHVVEGGEWRVARGNDHRISRCEPLEALAVNMRLGNASHLHLAPAGAGRGRGGGTAKIVVGVVLVAAAVVTAGAALAAEAPAAAGVGGAGAAAGSAGSATGLGAALGSSVIGVNGVLTAGTVGIMGISMILAGISMVLAPHKQRPVDANASFTLTGATNSNQEGTPVPLVYGRVRVGSVVGGVALEINDYNATSGGATPTGLLFAQGV